MAEKNSPIGWVPCPIRGCEVVADLFRYRERGDSEVSVANRRFAGKLYCRCDGHGKFGGDAADTKLQEWLLNEGHVWRPDESREKPARASSAAPAPTPANAPAKAAPAPATKVPAAPAKQAPVSAAQGWPWD